MNALFVEVPRAFVVIDDADAIGQLLQHQSQDPLVAEFSGECDAFLKQRDPAIQLPELYRQIAHANSYYYGTLFVMERKRFARDPRLRSITGAKRLRELLQPPMAIEVMNDPFRHRSREAYFKDVVARLSRLGRPALVFLDPDKGIAARRATENHVAVNELTQVWEALNPGSVLVVFQFAQRSAGWRENAIDLFGRAVGVSPRLITYFQCPRVVFLSSVKAGGACRRDSRRRSAPV